MTTLWLECNIIQCFFTVFVNKWMILNATYFWLYSSAVWKGYFLLFKREHKQRNWPENCIDILKYTGPESCLHKAAQRSMWLTDSSPHITFNPDAAYLLEIRFHYDWNTQSMPWKCPILNGKWTKFKYWRLEFLQCSAFLSKAQTDKVIIKMSSDNNHPLFAFTGQWAHQANIWQQCVVGREDQCVRFSGI